MDRNVNIITDLKGNKIVLINDIVFKGKRSVNWDDVKNYLETYVGEFYEIADTKAKAKANASQGIPAKNITEMLRMAGIGIIHVLHCLFMMKEGKWNDIMCFMPLC